MYIKVIIKLHIKLQHFIDNRNVEMGDSLAGIQATWIYVLIGYSTNTNQSGSKGQI